jgi:hypothetical protein
MTTQFYTKSKPRRRPLVRALFASNLLFIAGVLFAWQSMLMVIVGPLGWGADHQVPSDQSLNRLIEYPLLVFWAGPAVAVLVGKILIENRHYKTAFGIMVLPLLVFMLMFALYALVPNASG